MARVNILDEVAGLDRYLKESLNYPKTEITVSINELIEALRHSRLDNREKIRNDLIWALNEFYKGK